MEEKKVKICPVCKKEYTGYPAISRKDNKTEICPNCGVNEALEDYLIAMLKEYANKGKKGGK